MNNPSEWVEFENTNEVHNYKLSINWSESIEQNSIYNNLEDIIEIVVEYEQID